MRDSSMLSKNGIVLLVFAVLILVVPITPVRAQLPVLRDGVSYVSPFAIVYEKASPSIVLIQVKGEAESQSGSGEPWFNNRGGNRPYSGMGSGVIIDRDGHILTNNHVIVKPNSDRVADQILVVFNDNEEYEADVVGRDPESDLAVIKLKLEGKKLPQELVAELGDSDAMKPGDYAIAIGNPLGLERTITVGVISALGRYKNINPQGASIQFRNFIQTDALINPGNSGGALLDINGKVIGINDIYIAESGIGFAIPINLAKSIMKQIIATGVVRRGALGINIEDVTRELQEKLQLPDREGVYITRVLPGTPAEKIGLSSSDVIVSLNGEKMRNSNEFLLRVGNLPPGTKIGIGVIKKKELKNLTLELADRNDIISDSGRSTEWRGIHVVDLGSSQTEQYDLEGINGGVVVVSVRSGSPASDTTIEPGDVIVEVNTSQIDTVADFEKIKKETGESKKPILIYRLRKQPNGRIIKGFIAVKGE